jgi:uncharacterized protein
MKSFFSVSVILLFTLLSPRLTAQTSETDSTSSHLQIEKGIALYDEGKYDEALSIFGQVSDCDPNYWWACYESALTLFETDQKEKALAKCLESADLNDDNVATHALIGSLLDDLGRTDEAISILEKAIVRWPFNQNLLFNLAVCQINKKEFRKAEDILMRSIRINPYHRSSHLALGKVNLSMGRIAQSYLAYNMAVILNPSVGYLTEFERVVTGKQDSLCKPYLYPYSPATDHRKWDELSGLLKSEMAFRDGFDYNYKVSYVTLRQSLMLFRKMNYEPADTSLYNQFYVRFFSDMMQHDYFEAYLNYCFKNANDPQVNDWLAKNQDELNEFISWAQNCINTWRTYGFSAATESEKIAVYHFNENGKLESIGKKSMSPAEVRNGEFIGLNSDGGIETRANYVNDEEEGEKFIYWPNGKVKQHLYFHAGVLDGLNLTYYSSGKCSGSFPRVKGKQQGTEEEYLASGALFLKSNYTDNQLTGDFYKVVPFEAYSLNTTYTADKIQGKVTEKWMNGVRKSEVSAIDSLFEGPFKSWYPTAKPESEGSYKKGISYGKWVNYYPDGSKQSEGELDENGELTGTRTSYFRNGKKESEESSYTAGKLNGTSIRYFSDGSVKLKQTYADNIPVRLESFDAEGKRLFASESSDDIMKVKIFYADGTLESEGNLKKGDRDGNWKIYDPLGRLLQELQYADGLQEGPQMIYHGNGNISEKYNCDSNRIVGVYEKYYSTGNLNIRGSYNKNGRNGEWVSYYSNDSVQNRSFYTDGRSTGRQFFYTPTGTLSCIQYYNEDEKAARLKIYDHSGMLTNDQKFDFDSVWFSECYPSGKLKVKKLMANNVNHGMAETYYPNGQPGSQKNFVYGLPDGVEKHWDFKGNLTFVIPYVLGKINGEVKGYRYGKLWYTDMYEMGESQGYYREYHDNGKLYCITRYENDQKDGNSDFYAPDSSFIYRLIYSEGVLTGYTYKDAKGAFTPFKKVGLNTTEILCYYPTGTVSARISMKNGFIDGESKIYFPNGKLMLEKRMIKGDREGATKSYYANGNLKELITYRNDEKEGLYEFYYSSGKKRESGKFIAGETQGEWFVYSETGALTNTLLFNNDEVYDIK